MEYPVKWWSRSSASRSPSCGSQPFTSTKARLDANTLRWHLRSGHVVDVLFETVEQIREVGYDMLAATSVGGSKVMVPVDEIVIYEGVEGVAQ